MNISKCRACGSKVPLTTKNCPNCGARVLHPILGLVVAVVLLIVMSPFIFPSFPSNKKPIQNVDQPPAISYPIESANPSPVPSEEHSSIYGPGTYTVGRDIAAGTYDCVAASGFGVIRGEVAAFGEPGFVQTMGVESDIIECAHSYSNLTLADGDTLYIEMGLSVDFQTK